MLIELKSGEVYVRIERVMSGEQAQEVANVLKACADNADDTSASIRWSR